MTDQQLTQALPAGLDCPQKKALTPLPSEWIERLFSRLSAMYGARFLDMWRDVDHGDLKKTWASDLSGFDKRDIAEAILRLKTKPFPPTLPEFWILCDGAKKIRLDEENRRKSAALMLPNRPDPNDPETRAAIARCLETAKAGKYKNVFGLKGV